MSELGFVPGINVVWGASNGGKSFILAALDFMFGSGSSLPDIKMIRGYDRVWLCLDLPRAGRVTLARGVTGGSFDLYEGEVDPQSPGATNRTLAADHRAKGPNISAFLLGELGIGVHQLDRTLNGDKATFTFRHVAPYVLTDETSMMATWSPTQIDPRAGDTFNKNVFKFIMTGIDGSATVVTDSPETQKRGNAGKLELIDELLSEAHKELQEGWPDGEGLSDQERRLNASLGAVGDEAAERQIRLDDLRARRRDALEKQAFDEDGRSELVLTLERFDLLAAVYENDIARLDALAEGGAALLAGAGRPCPHCGADPEHQRHSHGLGEIEQTYVAVEAEVRKIRLEQADLRRTIVGLVSKRDELDGRIQKRAGEIEGIEASIRSETPLESSIRANYERLDLARERVRRGLSIQRRIEDLEARKREIAAFKPTRLVPGSVVAGISGSLGDEFAQDVQSILHAWKYPGPPRVSFDTKAHDITLNGDSRRGNGKGVRALMHSAFKIGVFTFCRRHSLPHPGIIVLDSPLVSYRDGHKSKHGPLDEDEKLVGQTQLKHHFYEYLLRTCADVQYLVIENDAPPIALGEKAKVTTFAGEDGVGDRRGFFPG
ncbi:hypothetical protein [Methylobacterium sp. AMS5]|uniref:hypothetical protein n=1 Tax=Methylobacterium sp. AMS5 TaxID=925818 RepID=UPI00130E45BA|nr:hypothetical protein [Methylobacterium sp. AMS5]